VRDQLRQIVDRTVRHEAPIGIDLSTALAREVIRLAQVAASIHVAEAAWRIAEAGVDPRILAEGRR